MALQLGRAPVTAGRVGWSRGSLEVLARRTVSSRDVQREQAKARLQPQLHNQQDRPVQSESSKNRGQGRPPRQPKKQPFIFTDGALLLGDAVMLAATELSSERIFWEDFPSLLAVLIGTWWLGAATMGDYRGEPPQTENWYISQLGPVFLAVVDAMLTWALANTVAIAVFSLLVSSNLIDSDPLLQDLATENLSPQLEVSVACLITMACWRGMVARLRY